MSDRPHPAPPAPFQLAYSPQIPQLLRQLRCSIVLSTYQAGKLIFLSAPDDERLVQLPRTFDRAMAVAVRGNHLAVATRETVEVFAADERLAPGYPSKPNTYDTLYAPRLTFRTGAVDCHGLEWGADGVWAVNTNFGCLSTLSESYSFVPRWRPPFLSAIAPEDRCHLNGFAFAEGRPKYATCLSTADEREGWRKALPDGGVLVDVESNEVVLRDLPMPHSPRLVDGTLYLLLSATGRLARADVASGRVDVVRDLGGFVRGLAHHEGYLFVGLSKLRKNSSTFRDLPIADIADHSGVAIVHEPTGALVGEIRYHQSVDEIFDVAVLPGVVRPGIMRLNDPDGPREITTPQTTYWGVARGV